MARQVQILEKWKNVEWRSQDFFLMDDSDFFLTRNLIKWGKQIPHTKYEKLVENWTEI